MYILAIFDMLHSLFVSVAAGHITSSPPNVHSYLVQLYDYPVARIALFGSILATAMYAPITAIVYGISTAVVCVEIMRASNGNSEGFENLQDTLNVQVAKRMNPVEEAIRKVKEAEQLLKTVDGSS